jgi:hypothetical protein
MQPLTMRRRRAATGPSGLEDGGEPIAEADSANEIGAMTT